MRNHRSRTFFVGVGVIAGSMFAGAGARAASIIKDPNPPEYKVEIEPHATFNFAGVGFLGEYRTFGWGPGVRFSIPLMSPGFVKSINDSIAISFGVDLMHYDGYYFCHGGACDTVHGNGTEFWSLYFPVAMQWNFWLTDKWSVFGEPGLAIRHAFYDNCLDGFGCSRTELLPAFYGGGRFHFADTTALTLRIGYPTGFSIGLSFF